MIDGFFPMRAADNVQRAIGCGFTAGRATVGRECDCGHGFICSTVTHKFPMPCEPPKVITIERVAQIEGVQNSLFLIGDVDGFRMNRNFILEIPSDSINVVSGNFPVYALLKDGNQHTFAFSTANIESVLRQNCHMFTRDGIRFDTNPLIELAPQDQSVEGLVDHGHDDCECKPPRHFEFRIISNMTMADCSTTIEILVFDCGALIDKEIWVVIPVRCFNINTAMGSNIAAWTQTPRTCGDLTRIPVKSSNNGQLVIANLPNCGCMNRRVIW